MARETSDHVPQVEAQPLPQRQALSPHPASRRLWGVCALALVLVVGIGMVVFVGGGLGGHRAGESLQTFGQVPDVALLERSGQPVTTGDLRGKVWITAFVFTRCPDVCPLISSRMAELQTAFASEADVRLVSITVDPEHDTPEVLTQYAQRFGAQPQRWWFLTGEKAVIYRLAREGFYLGVVDPSEARQSSAMPGLLPPRGVQVSASAGGILTWLTPARALAHHGTHAEDQVQQAVLHSPRLVLVDRRGQIRNYYNSADPEALRYVQRDVRRLLREHQP